MYLTDAQQAEQQAARGIQKRKEQVTARRLRLIAGIFIVMVLLALGGAIYFDLS